MTIQQVADELEVSTDEVVGWIEFWKYIDRDKGGGISRSTLDWFKRNYPDVIEEAQNKRQAVVSQ